MPKTISHETTQALLILHSIGWKNTRIALALGIHRHSVRTSLKKFGIYTQSPSTYLDSEEEEPHLTNLILHCRLTGLKLSEIWQIIEQRYTSLNTFEDLEDFALKHGITSKGDSVKSTNLKRCKHCKQSFTPDFRHQKTQQFCQLQPCRIASKKYSQEKWSKSQ